MKDLKTLIILSIVTILLRVAISLDNQGCKSFSDAYDILSGNKKKREIALENELARREAERRFVEQNRAEMKAAARETNRNSVATVRNYDRHSSNYPKYSSNSVRHASNSVKYSSEQLNALANYRREPNGYFSRAWESWKSIPELRDTDMVVIKIVVARDGKIVSKNIESTASKQATEFLAQKLNSYKFKPLPEEYLKASMSFKYRFNKDSFGAGSF